MKDNSSTSTETTFAPKIKKSIWAKMYYSSRSTIFAHWSQICLHLSWRIGRCLQAIDTLNQFWKFQKILCIGLENMTNWNFLPIVEPEESILWNFLLASIIETVKPIVLKFSELNESAKILHKCHVSIKNKKKKYLFTHSLWFLGTTAIQI